MKTILTILLTGVFIIFALALALGILFSGCSTDTPETVDTDTQETVDTDTPETVDTDTQETVDTDTPETVDTDTPETVDTDTPETVDTDTQETVDTDTPETVDTDTPETVDTDTPETVDTDTPETVDTDTQTTSTLPTCGPLDADFDECIDENHLGQYTIGTVSTDPDCLPQPSRVIECKCIKHEPFDYCKDDV